MAEFCIKERFCQLQKDTSTLKEYSEHAEWERYVKGQLWVGVPNASFFAHIWWTRLAGRNRKRKRQTIMNVPLPGLPSLAYVMKETQQRAVGQWDQKDRLDGHMYSASQLADLFADGCVPIGKICTDKSMPGRIVNLQVLSLIDLKL